MATVEEPPPSANAESLASSGARGVHLLRVLGVVFGLAVIVGNTIGAGILRTPGTVAAELPNVLLILGAWVVGAIYALLGANSLAELGAMMPRSGGQYVFARRAFGDYAGFVVGWSDWISTAGSAALVSIVIGECLVALFPALAGGKELFAGAVVVAFALLQWRGINWGSRAQNLTSLLKALAFLALVAACFALGGGGAFSRGAYDVVHVETSALRLVSVTVALQAIIYAYDGWTGVIYFSEEVRDPARDIPRSMFGGVLSVAAIYLLVNAALLYVLPLEVLGTSELAAGAAAGAIFGPRGDALIRVLTIVALLSSVNALQLIASRVPFAMSRDRLFPERAVRVNRGGTPTVALLAGTLVALAFIATGTFNQVLGVAAFFFVANYTVSFAALFALRRREPDATRPFRAWGYPFTNALALAASLAFLAGMVKDDTRNSIYALAALAASYPAFILLRRSRAGGAG
ncbi:MAG TPA: APC family permease [Pyrinomonadaceae bacterium]|nr:APC family permease [Pyrinomonadaceae bacterium]